MFLNVLEEVQSFAIIIKLQFSFNNWLKKNFSVYNRIDLEIL